MGMQYPIKFDNSLTDTAPAENCFKTTAAVDVWDATTLSIDMRTPSGWPGMGSLFVSMAVSQSWFQGVLLFRLVSDPSKFVLGGIAGLTQISTNWWKVLWTPIHGNAVPYSWGNNTQFTMEVIHGWQTTFTSSPGTGVRLWDTNGFRLSLESGVAVSTTDQVGKTFVYAVPHTSDAIALYNGVSWDIINDANGADLWLGTMSTNTNYDVFGYNLGGTLALEKVAWASAIARATNLVRQNGVWVKNGDRQKRYLGTFRSTSTTTTESSQTRRFLFNADNRLPAQLYGTGDSAHSYASSTPQKFNNSDSESTNYLLNGLGDGRMLDGAASVYGYAGAGGDTRIAVSISNSPSAANMSLETGLVQTSDPTWTFVMAPRLVMPLGLNYIRICEATYVGTNWMRYNSRSFSFDM